MTSETSIWMKGQCAYRPLNSFRILGCVPSYIGSTKPMPGSWIAVPNPKICVSKSAPKKKTWMKTSVFIVFWLGHFKEFPKPMLSQGQPSTWVIVCVRTAFKGKSCSPQTEGITSDHQCGWSCCSPIGKKIYGNHLVGGFNQPLWKMNDFVSWDDYSIPNIWKVNPKPNSMVPVTTNQWWLTIINHHYPIPNHQPAMSSSHPIHPFLPPSSCPSSSGELPMGSSAAKLYICQWLSPEYPKKK